MNKTLSALLGVFVLAVLSIFAAPSASAATTIYLKDAHKGVFAADFKQGDGFNPGTSIEAPADKDVWHFINPQGDSFTSLRVTFETPDHETAFVDSTVFQPNRPNQAYVVTPSGWKLIDASAEVPNGEEIVLSHTRAATTGTPPGEEEPTCETDPTLEGCEEGEEPTCEDDPTLEGCQEEGTDPTCEDDPTLEGCEETVTPPVVTPPAVTPIVTPPAVTPPAATVTTPTAVLAATGALPHTGGSLALLAAAALVIGAGASLTAVARKVNH